MANDLVTIKELSPKQYKAIELYCSGKDEDEIVAEVGVTKATLRSWIATNPHFRSMIRQHFSAYLTVQNVQVGAAYEKAIKKATEMLDDTSLTSMQMLKVIQTILHIVNNAKLMEKDDTETEMEMSTQTEKDSKGNTLSITESKHILQRIRGHGPNQVLETEGGEIKDVSGGTEAVL
jgi:hypothetical protein